MIRTLTTKEIVDNILSFKFAITSLICLISIPLSVHFGRGNYERHLEEVRRTNELNQKRLKVADQWEDVGKIGLLISRRLSPLSIFCSGIAVAAGTTVEVTSTRLPEATENPYSSNPTFPLIADIDLTTVVKIILSLFAIIFSYNAICGEKERGTLRLLSSNQMPKHHIILGKILGGYISLLIPFVTSFVIGIILLHITAPVSLAREDYAGLFLVFIVYLSYIMTFFMLGLFISSLTSSSSVSLMLSVFIWACYVILIPKFSVVVATHLKPIPSLTEMNSQELAYFQEYERALTLEEFKALGAVSSSERDSLNLSEFTKRAKEFRTRLQQELDQKLIRLREHFLKRQWDQLGLALRLSRFSPASVFSYAVMNLSGTGFKAQRRFSESVMKYRHEFVRVVEGKVAETTGGLTVYAPVSQAEEATETMQKVTKLRLNLNIIPVYPQPREPLSILLADALTDLGLLLLYSTLFFACTYMAFLRYDVR